MSAKLLWFKLVNEDEIVNPCSSFKKIGVSNVRVDGHKGGLPFFLLLPWTYNLFRLRLALWRCSGEPIKTDCNIPLVISPQEIRFEAKLYQQKEVT